MAAEMTTPQLKKQLEDAADVSVLTVGLLGSSGIAGAEELGPEQARAFIVGKLFAFTCFEGTTGMGRILSDGSVVGSVRIRGQGETRFARLPAGTVRIDGQFLCAHVASLPFTPCARVEKIDYRSFRSSLVGLSFAYCDFYQRNPRSHLVGERDLVTFPGLPAALDCRSACTLCPTSKIGSALLSRRAA
jgi:hypothetical protein